MNAIEKTYEEYKSIIQFLDENKQPSLSSDIRRYFTKILILSTASFFEHTLKEILIKFISIESNENPRIVNFVKKKAIGMQYHTFFNWGEFNNPNKPGKNANAFFALFGSDYRNEMEICIREDIELGNAQQAFLEIGHLRNILVHNNFADYNQVNKTPEEVFEMYSNSLHFIQFVETQFCAKNYEQ